MAADAAAFAARVIVVDAGAATCRNVPLLAAALGVVVAARAGLGASGLILADPWLLGAHLVDISPLSPLGALCLAYPPPGAGRQTLFSRLIWRGLARCPLGAILCQALFGFAREF